MKTPDPTWGTFQPCVVRGAEEERQSVRTRSRAVLACVALATVALVALAARSAGHEASLAQAPAQSQSLAQAQSLAPSGSRSPLQLLAQRAAKASTLWSSNTVPSSAGMIAVSEDDIDRLGLRAPPGFNVRSVNVTADDIDRLGLKAPVGFNVASINVTEADIDRLGLKAPTGARADVAMVVTEDDMERYGLKPLTADAGSASGIVQVTPEDVEHYGLVAPAGFTIPSINVTAEDVARLGLSNPSISEDEAKELGIFGDGPVVNDDDIASYGMKVDTPTPEEAAALGLGNSTVRLSAEEAAAYGLTGPISLTPNEAESLGLSQAAAGNLVTEDDLDRLGLRDPTGWNATGYTHLMDLRRQVALRVAAAKNSRSKLQAWQRLMLRAKRAVQQLLDQKRHVAQSKEAVAQSPAAKKVVEAGWKKNTNARLAIAQKKAVKVPSP